MGSAWTGNVARLFLQTRVGVPMFTLLYRLRVIH